MFIKTRLPCLLALTSYGTLLLMLTLGLVDHIRQTEDFGQAILRMPSSFGLSIITPSIRRMDLRSERVFADGKRGGIRIGLSLTG